MGDWVYDEATGDFRGTVPDAYLEPKDEREGEHDEDCAIDHEPEDSPCYSREDWLADQADAERDRMKDEAFDRG